MKIERSHAVVAAPYQRTDQRQGHANGFKPKTIHTSHGALTVAVPQTRDLDSYQKSVRSERALELAVAEMYV